MGDTLGAAGRTAGLEEPSPATLVVRRSMTTVIRRCCFGKGRAT
ncbi:hypothetical protein [Streptomyces brasiliensis]|nr:hypothetical protein [Streptomyces brasiliensis]